MNRLNKRLFCALLLTIMLLCIFSSCKDSEVNPNATPVVQDEKTPISMYDLSCAMLAADPTLTEMTTVNGSAENAESQFAYVSDMDYSLVDDYFIAYATDGSKCADEIVVISLKDKKNVNVAIASLNAHVHDRENLYTQYAPEQVENVQKASVFSDGQFAVLIICKDASAVKDAFSDFIKK